ncbi:MAG: Fe-S cluster assembly protein SufD [Alphaproteobacteria bacterium]|nr:Fe-S cluster assembly protein SufD [Alphaproteobacteria bacterium]
MSIAVMKTKAELSFAESFDTIRDQLPGGAGVSAARQAAADKFAQLGLPHRRIEEWKYTDLRNAMKEALPSSVGDETALTIADVIVALGPLAHLDASRVVFVNGAYREELSSASDVAGVEIESLAAVLSEGGERATGLANPAGPDNDAVLALNTAYMTDGSVVSVKEAAAVEKPLLLVHVRAGMEPGFTAVRNVIEVGGKASVQIIEAFVSLPGAVEAGQVNTATRISVGEEAKVLHVSCAADGQANVTHLSNWIVNIAAGADYGGFQLTQGVALARNQIFVAFSGEGAKLDLSGVFLGRNNDHIDTTLVVDHAVPSCESRELFKGVLDDNARGVFQGKIIVQPIAQKTDGKQMSQGLLLSPNAEFDSKPELEIFADDVVCGHGATCAQLDEDLMFYCQSRGIPADVAKVLLIESFIGEAVENIGDEDIVEAIMGFARGWLAQA